MKGCILAVQRTLETWDKPAEKAAYPYGPSVLFICDGKERRRCSAADLSRPRTDGHSQVESSFNGF